MDQFGLKGAITQAKHQRLARYASAVPNLSDYKVAVSVRHPLERAVSYYFSPHRWSKKVKNASANEQLELDADDFLQVTASLPAISNFLEVDGEVRAADYVIRFENIHEDFAAFVSALALPVPTDLPHRNASAADAEIKRRAFEDPKIRAEVSRRYAHDFELFGYAA